MAATIDVSDDELLELDEALRGQREVAGVRLFEGGQPLSPRPMLWPCPLEAVQAPHLAQAEASPADLHVIRRAFVGGGGSIAVRNGAYLYAAGAYPSYVKTYLDENIAPQTWAFETGWFKRKTLHLECAFALVHFNLMWGHWLTEVFPKLFVIRALAERGVRAPILIPSNVPVFVAEVIEDVLPGQKVIVYDPGTHKVAVRRLLLPSMLQREYVFHPWFGEALDAYAQTRTPSPDRSRVFVSRAAMRTAYAYREMSNEPEIEAIAEEAGFQIIRPEFLPWREQVGVFAGAHVIAGEFGSGLHNALVSPRGAKVVALNWIGEIQSRIANFRGQDIGYVLPDDGQPRIFHLEGSLQRFRIDPVEFRDRLSEAVEAAEAR